MIIKCINQITSDVLISTTYDLIIAACGFEERGIFIPLMLKNGNHSKKIAFSFSDYKDNNIRLKNEKFYRESNYTVCESSGIESKYIVKELENFILDSIKDEIKILIDYTSMTRIWYGAILNFLKNFETQKRLIIHFSYAIAKFHKPPLKELKTKYFTPIEGYCNLSVPSVPTALIIGLGYEKNKAYGLKEFFDAEKIFLFYTKDSLFTTPVMKINKELLILTKDNCKVPYNLQDLLMTKTLLFDICKLLIDNYRLIIAPCGPKPFTLLSFLISLEVGNIDVWRISGNEIGTHSDREAEGNIVILELYYYPF